MNSAVVTMRTVLAAVIALALAQSAQAATTSAAALANGFYRNRGTPTVYRVQDGTVCAVVSEGHLKALGATHRSIHVLTDPVDFLNGKPSRPPCPWPDGLYRPSGETTIIKLSDGTACILPSTSGEDVIEVGADDDVTAGKKFTGRCST